VPIGGVTGVDLGEQAQRLGQPRVDGGREEEDGKEGADKPGGYHPKSGAPDGQKSCRLGGGDVRHYERSLASRAARLR
jgi:hypothetical protein